MFSWRSVFMDNKSASYSIMLKMANGLFEMSMVNSVLVCQLSIAVREVSNMKCVT